jgi:hypothetical protein
MVQETRTNGSFYEFTAEGVGTVTISAEIVVYGDALYGYADCQWRLSAPDISILEEVAIDHSGDIHCQAPPVWSIVGITLIRSDHAGNLIECVGTITFEEFTLTKLPFVNRWMDIDGYGVPAEDFFSLACGTCSQFCSVLCVRRGNNYDLSAQSQIDFIWNEYTLRWEAIVDGYEQYISPVEVEGVCYISLDAIGVSDFTGDLLQIGDNLCALGMALEATNYAGDFIRVSCNRCSCWRYVCGNCRCVCSTLCVVGVLDGELVEMSLAWDAENWRWGDDYFSVGLSADENDDCQVTITGFAEPVPVRNDCGSRLVFSVTQDLTDMLYAGVTNYLYGYCQQCADDCGQGGTCLEFCEDVPRQLNCEVCPTEWAPMLGCDPYNLCFECINITLSLVFVGNEAAGEWRWVGHGMISCHDCNPTPTVPRNYWVSIDIGCDGQGTFRVERPGTTPCQHSFSFTIPCGAYDIWDVEFETDSACADGLDGCCDEAAFHGHITL